MKLAKDEITNNTVSEQTAVNAGIIISDPTIRTPDSSAPDGINTPVQMSKPATGVKEGVVFDPMAMQEEVKRLSFVLAVLGTQFEQLAGNVDGFRRNFTTSQLSALVGDILQLTGSSASFEEVISPEFSFDAEGVPAYAVLIEPGTVLYGKAEDDHIVTVWISEDFFICITDSNNWRIDSNGNLINVNGEFEYFFFGSGAEVYPSLGTVQTVIAQGTSVFGQFNYYMVGTTSFQDMVVTNTANIKELTVTDKIHGSIDEADYATESDYATTAGSASSATSATSAATAEKATKDGDGNNIVSTYATKSELLPAAKKVQYDTTSHIYICTTDAATAKKVVTITDLDITGNFTFRVMLANGNTADSISMEINGTEYALKIYKAGTKSAVYAGMDAGTILEVFFDGTDIVAVSNPIVKQDTSSSSGYQILLDGKIRQCLKALSTGITSYSDSWVTVNVSFPITMPDKYYAISISCRWYNNNEYLLTSGWRNKTTTGFELYVKYARQVDIIVESL